MGLIVTVTNNFPNTTAYVIQKPNHLYSIAFFINLNTFTIDKALYWNKSTTAWEPIPDIDPNDVDTILALYLKT